LKDLFRNEPTAELSTTDESPSDHKIDFQITSTTTKCSDDELGRLFDETDEEMIALVEQNVSTIKCKNNDELDAETDELSEQNNSEMGDVNEEKLSCCANCSLPFLSSENLKRHETRCSTKLFKFRCKYCYRKFTRENNKIFHEQNCEQKDDDDNNHARQSKVEEFLPSSKKRKTGLTTMQVGGSGGEHGETWQVPKIVESALNRHAVTYRKEFDVVNKKDLMGRMSAVLSTFHPIIEAELSMMNDGIKYYFTLRMVFHQGKDPDILTDPPVSFRSEVFTSLNLEKLSLHAKVECACKS
jgi:hypothetical protein